MTDPSLPLSREELKALREKASRGVSLSLEETRLFVLSTRKSYLAAETKSSPKDRVKKTGADDAQIDFF